MGESKMLTKSQFIDGVSEFVSDEMLSKQTGLPLWIGAAALNLAKLNADKMIDSYLENSMVKALGIVSEGGLIDIDLVYRALKQAEPKPFPIIIGKKKPEGKISNPFGIFTIKEADLDALYNRLKQLPTAEETEE